MLVTISSRWPASITWNSGTGISRVTASVEALSSNSPSADHSSRTRPAVSTVIR